MGVNMSKRKIFFFFSFIIPFSFYLSLNADTLSITLKSNSYKIINLPDGYQRIEMEGFGHISSPGNPELPSKVYNIALPPLTDFKNLDLIIENAEIEELPGTYNIKPAPPWVAFGEEKIFWGKGKNIVDGKNMDVYGKNEKFPEEFIVKLPYSQMRKWKFTKILFYPFQYNPVTKKLYLIKSVEFSLNFQKKSIQDLEKIGISSSEIYQILKDNLMDEEASEIIFNYEEAKKWYMDSEKELQKTLNNFPLDTKSTQYNYVIITTKAIRDNSAKLSHFVRHLECQGYSVKIVTEDDFDTLPGNERADRIRKYLQNNYITMGIRYVLLIGNPDPYDPRDPNDIVGDIPMKMCFVDTTNSDNSKWPGIPTDYYYADLTGNWDLDGDGFYGEHFGGDDGNGGVDFTPEVYVGRIPVYNNDYSKLNDILQKIINYEISDDVSWRKKMLLPMAMSNYENEDESGVARTDGRELPKYVIEDYLQRNGFSYYVLYEKEGLSPVPDNAPYDNPSHLGISKKNVIDEWKNGYGCVFWWAHGSGRGAYRKIWSSDTDNDNIPDSGEINWVTFFNIWDCSQLDNSKPSIVYHSSCLNGYPEDSNNLGYSLLVKGAIATISASRESYYRAGT